MNPIRPGASESKSIRVAFFGTPEFSVPALTALINSESIEVCVVITQPDRKAGRGQKLMPSPIKSAALKANIPVIQPENIRKDEERFLEDLANYAPLDAGIVIAFGQILPLSVLNLPRSGSINIHASLLPRWRGAAPIHRAIMEGDPATGVCLMHMEEGLDTGGVYSSSEIKISASDTFGSLHDRLASEGANLLVQDLPSIVQGTLPVVPQPNVGITYAHKIKNSEAWINWDERSETINRLVRALNPFPGAFTTLGQKRLKIFRVEAMENPPKPGDHKSGEVCFVDADTLGVYCNNSAIRILELQPEGKRRMNTVDFLRGHPVTLGAILGDSRS